MRLNFLTALGIDPFSQELRRRWTDAGLDPSLILTDTARRPGLYAITNDADGERHFTYQRGESAARHLFSLPGADTATTRADASDLIVISLIQLISLAILPREGRDRLFDLARRVRARGDRVVFDRNFRPALWPDRDEARMAHARATALADIALPTLEDEAALIGTEDIAGGLDHWRAAGVPGVVLNTGAERCIVGGATVPPPVRLRALDTSGAGDAFDAGYLHARYRGAQPIAAAHAGHRMAGWVVMQRGALPGAAIDASCAYLRSNAEAELALPLWTVA